MALVAFDTHKFIKTLRKSGASEAQAEAFAAAVCDLYETAGLATKTDLKQYETAIRQDIEKLEINIRHEIDNVHREIDNVRQETRHEIAGLRKEIKSMGLRLTIFLGGIVFAIVNAGPFLPKLLHWWF